jgi:hypothetical protein
VVGVGFLEDGGHSNFQSRAGSSEIFSIQIKNPRRCEKCRGFLAFQFCSNYFPAGFVVVSSVPVKGL